MTTNILQSEKEKKRAEEEARKIRETVDKMIKRKEIRGFMVEHGFITQSGKLTKRYGG